MSEKKPVRFRFGPFELDSPERRFLHDGQSVKHKGKILTGKDFDVLEHLVSRAQKRVTEQDLIDHVWNHAQLVPNIVTTSISHLRAFLGDNPKAPQYIETVPPKGYRFIKPVEVIEETVIITDPSERSTRSVPIGLPVISDDARQYIRLTANGSHGVDFNELDTIHVHVDGADAEQLVDSLVRELRDEGHPSKMHNVIDRISGPQRAEDPATYLSHTPGGTHERLDYFSTHLFGGLGETKRQLQELLSHLHQRNVREIVIEAERIIGKVGERPEDVKWSHISILDFPVLSSGDVGYEKCPTKPIEIHFACDIPRRGRWLDKQPLELSQLLDITNGLGISVGGWFLFDKHSKDKWAYRSNMFVEDVQQEEVEDIRRRLKTKIEEIGKREEFSCEVKALVEHTIGIWQTPLKVYTEPRSIMELSDWEGKYPNLRTFWVITPNFLGDVVHDVQKAMIRNLQRGVTYTYYLRSVADYLRLCSFAKDMDSRLKVLGNTNGRIEAVLRDAAIEDTLTEVIQKGCFIANPLPSEDGIDDAEGYQLLMSAEEPGKIAGGRVMNNDRVKEIVNILKPIKSDGRALQGICMPLQRTQQMLKTPSKTIMCISLKGLSEIMGEIGSQNSADLLSKYDLLVASVASKVDGQVVTSTESGYVLMFEEESSALLCARQIREGVIESRRGSPVKFLHKIAIDCGVMWRGLRAHGTDYCGMTINRCRELLRRTNYGEVTMTPSFVDALSESQSANVVQTKRMFTFNKRVIPIWTVRGDVA